jgi:hypothetical protein
VLGCTRRYLATSATVIIWLGTAARRGFVISGFSNTPSADVVSASRAGRGFETARSLAGNHDFGVTLAELYLSNRSASGINLLQDDGRAALGASWRSARHRLATSPDLDGGRERIEVGREYRLFQQISGKPSLFLRVQGDFAIRLRVMEML